MRALVTKLVLAGAALMLFAFWVHAQAPADRPAGVPAENWIRISDSVGIAIANVTSTPLRSNYSFAPNEPKVIPLVQSATGVVIAKYNGVWTRIDFAAPPAQAQHLDL